MSNKVVSILKKKRTWATVAVIGLAGSKIVTGDFTGGFSTLLSFFGT
jgi:hypothetical protein